jgi:hypothetical protein
MPPYSGSKSSVFRLGLSHYEEGGSNLIRNVGNYLQIATESCSRRHGSSSPLLCNRQISYRPMFGYFEIDTCKFPSGNELNAHMLGSLFSNLFLISHWFSTQLLPQMGHLFYRETSVSVQCRRERVKITVARLSARGSGVRLWCLYFCLSP